ncbi:hypothetical protein [Azospirillum doebereinerae]|uniref:Uncharacterized protein n=1 Tax=Azospirillum doebereinerae TaxID=92933 RepID=A0A433IZN2_9PROT|nr:hypothetical protein [Azospirillum doebereinerae]RUQ61235.1 hypothetical protein EJ913_29975 [Azospirillum doebereinerae]
MQLNPHFQSIASDTSARMVDAFTDAQARGLSPSETVCLALGVLKALISATGPDAERLARGAAQQFEALAAGQPLPTEPLH